MLYIKEPEGIDFVVDPKPLTDSDKKVISDIIAHYNATGQKISKKKLLTQSRKSKKSVRCRSVLLK